jgi:hypothetical protein
MIDGKTYVIHYVNFKNRTYKSVNPFIYIDDYPLGKLIGKTENEGETVFAVKGHQDLIAVLIDSYITYFFRKRRIQI